MRVWPTTDWPAKEFKNWKRRMGWSNMRIAKELCISRTSLLKYLDEGAPHMIKLACETLERKEKGRK